MGFTYDGEWRFDKRHGYGELKNDLGEIVYKGIKRMCIFYRRLVI